MVSREQLMQPAFISLLRSPPFSFPHPHPSFHFPHLYFPAEQTRLTQIACEYTNIFYRLWPFGVFNLSETQTQTLGLFKVW